MSSLMSQSESAQQNYSCPDQKIGVCFAVQDFDAVQARDSHNVFRPYFGNLNHINKSMDVFKTTIQRFEFRESDIFEADDPTVVSWYR